MQCKNCGAEVGIEYRLCPYCHSEIEYPQKIGSYNQPIIIQNVIQNTNTNTNVNNNSNRRPTRVNRTSKKSKTVTLILAIFLGFLGVHRFYVGKIKSGVLYAFTEGLFLIGWIKDIIKISKGQFTDGKGLLIKK